MLRRCALSRDSLLRLDGEELDEEDVEGATGEWVLELGGFTMLMSLELDHCTVTDAEVLPVGKLTALTLLSLFKCVTVTDVSVAALSGLTVLNLGGCRHKLTDVAVGALSGLTGLTGLGLGGCKVTDVGEYAG
jgi:hypothetical protein